MPADEDDFVDARAAMDFTPVPDLSSLPMTPAEADLRVCLATCEQLQRANAAAQALVDEQTAIIKQLRDDRRALAAQVKALKAELGRK